MFLVVSHVPTPMGSGGAHCPPNFWDPPYAQMVWSKATQFWYGNTCGHERVSRWSCTHAAAPPSQGVGPQRIPKIIWVPLQTLKWSDL